MSDPQEAPTRRDEPDVLSDQIGRSISSIWERHSGSRPVSINCEIAKDQVRCMLELPDAIEVADSADDADGDETDACYEGSEVVRSPQSSRYRNEATASVSRITGRRVLGFIAKRDPKTKSASDTFILERARVVH
jgi:hypothetical protein